MIFKRLNLRPWEILLGIAVAVLLLSVLLSKVSYSGSWAGDPALRNHLAAETVNRFVAEWPSSGTGMIAFLQSFHRFPTMVHESMLALFILCLNGINKVDFETVVHYAAWFATMWTLIGTCVIYWVLRMFSARWLAFSVLPICMLSGYVLLYANFPRQNMPSHVLGWMALVAYLHTRATFKTLPSGRAAVIGLLFGLSVPTHYSSAYLVFVFIAAELVLAKVQQLTITNLFTNWVRIFRVSVLVWLLIDLYFYLTVWLYPEEVVFGNESPGARHFSFIGGMLFAIYRLGLQAAKYKLEEPVWWFLPGFVFRNFGVLGAVFFLSGVLFLSLRMLRQGLNCGESRHGVQIVIVWVTIVVSAIVSLGFFQNARKLMVFYPAWCVAMVYGVGSIAAISSNVVAHGASLVRAVGTYISNDDLRSWEPRRAILATVGLLLGGHALLFWPEGEDIYHARRDTGYMREYLAANGIKKLLVYGAPELVMRLAESQVALSTVSKEEANHYEWIMIFRLYRGWDSELMDRLRNVKPVVSFKNQNALPITWYEFPVKKSFCDFDDPLTYSRSLYRWADVRGPMGY